METSSQDADAWDSALSNGQRQQPDRDFFADSASSPSHVTLHPDSSSLRGEEDAETMQTEPDPDFLLNDEKPLFLGDQDDADEEDIKPKRGRSSLDEPADHTPYIAAEGSSDKKPRMRLEEDVKGSKIESKTEYAPAHPLPPTRQAQNAAWLGEEDESPSKPTFGNNRKESPSQREKRKAKALSDASANWPRRYIGNFIVQAWSTTKGRGRVKEGDVVEIARAPPTIRKEKKTGRPLKEKENNIIRFNKDGKSSYEKTL